MSSQGDFRAKTSPWQASELAFLGHAQAYGQSSPASLGKYDPATHSLRTSQLLLLEVSTECLQTLPRWGWMHAGAVSGLMTSAPPISESGSGFWPTPTANDAKNNGGPAQHTKGQGGRNLNVAAQEAPWIPCLCCEEYWCTIHQEHAFECPCPEIEEWPRSPYLSGGKLNPMWTEWLMGWPIGWTALEPLATDGSPSVPPWPGGY